MKHSRQCPRCGKDIYYSSKYCKETAQDSKTNCRDCTRKGVNNPFFGKTHSKETINIIKEKRKQQIITDSHKENLRKAFSGKKNPMYGKTIYDIWLQKYGKEIADEKLKQWKVNKGKSQAGCKNPFFGKPLPKGVGNGMGCWYKDIFFRSLRELSFFLEFIDNKNVSWEKGEQERYKINYINLKGESSSYYPDFVVNKIIYECKPKKLWNILPNKLKREAAIEFCKEKDLKYEMIDVEPNPLIINQLYDSGLLVFTDKALEKYKLFKKKNP